jgi:hypothetical protein
MIVQVLRRKAIRVVHTKKIRITVIIDITTIERIIKEADQVAKAITEKESTNRET